MRGSVGSQGCDSIPLLGPEPLDFDPIFEFDWNLGSSECSTRDELLPSTTEYDYLE